MLLISKNPLIHLIFKQPISNVANGMALLNSFQFFEPKIFIDDGIGTKLLSPFQEFLEYGEAERRGERKNRGENRKESEKQRGETREEGEKGRRGGCWGHTIRVREATVTDLVVRVLYLVRNLGQVFPGQVWSGWVET